MKHFLVLLFFVVSITIQANSNSFFAFSMSTTNQQDRLEFSIFPNPLKDQRLFIKSAGDQEKHIEIYNVLGEKKYEIITTNESILLGELPSGIYIFKLEQNGMKGLKRLVIP